MIKFNIKRTTLAFFLIFASIVPSLSAGSGGELLKVEWSFKGLTGKFDRASLQRGFQVYEELRPKPTLPETNLFLFTKALKKGNTVCQDYT